MLWINHIRNVGKIYADYFIKKVVGEGRYGICFLAYSGCGTQVIIKRFKPASIKGNEERIAMEAVVLSQISHRAIPKLLGVIHEKDFYGFVLEKKPGDTVESLLFRQKHRFTHSEIFKIITQLIDILSYLHGKGITHGDIRPPNVLLDHGFVYLIDFGLSRRGDFIRCPYGIDFSYLGDFFLYLLYSSHKSRKGKRLAWYNELDLSLEQKMFLKKLLRLEEPYSCIEEVKKDFIQSFGHNKSNV